MDERGDAGDDAVPARSAHARWTDRRRRQSCRPRPARAGGGGRCPPGRSSRSGPGRAPAAIPRCSRPWERSTASRARRTPRSSRRSPTPTTSRSSRRPRPAGACPTCSRWSGRGTTTRRSTRARSRDLTKDIQTGFPKFYATAMAQMRYKNKIFGIPMDLNTLTDRVQQGHLHEARAEDPEDARRVARHGAEDQGAGPAADVAERQGRMAERRPVVLAARLHGPECQGCSARRRPARPRGLRRRSLTAATNVQKMQEAGLFSQNAASLDFVGRLHRVRDRQVGDALPGRQLRHARDRQHQQGQHQLRALPVPARRPA